MSAPVITFLSDYGLADGFVGVCHGVIARICPEARVIDLTHGIPRHDASAGALALAEALPYMPAGVHLAVVDPDVGASRRAVALRAADGRLLVGPDNGVLSLAAEGSGGVTEAADIAGSRLRLEPVSATFHGRDIFAPVSAHLAAGVPLAEVGTPLDPASLVRVELSRPRVQPSGAIVAHAVSVDRFGNVQLDVTHEDLAGSGLKLGRGVVIRLDDGRVEAAPFVRTFAEALPDSVLVYEDASRRLAVAVRHGDAAAWLGLAAGDELEIAPA